MTNTFGFLKVTLRVFLGVIVVAKTKITKHKKYKQINSTGQHHRTISYTETAVLESSSTKKET